MRTVYLLLFLVISLVAQAQIKATSKPLLIGETLELYSGELKETRQLNVYLPEGYHQTAKRYPVIFLLDGAVNEDFLHIAGLAQFAAFEWINKAPESIVVGISNIDRKRDFTFPTLNANDKKDMPTSGGSSSFINFIEKELQPLIAKQYRTSSQKTIIGQSLGGLLATEILILKPSLFDNYIIVSPSLWWNDESLLKAIPATTLLPRTVFIAVGKEGDIMENDAKALAEKLRGKHTVFFEFFPQYNHGDLLHFAVYNAFSKLFNPAP